MEAVFVSIVITILTGVLNHWHLLPKAPDDFIADWRTAHFSPNVKEQNRNVAIIYVSSDTLKHYPYTNPIHRGLIGQIIAEIDAATPTAIGIDIIFDRPTDAAADDNLIGALQKAKSPIILVETNKSESGVTDEALRWQSAFISKSTRASASPFFDTDDSTISLGTRVVRRFPRYEVASNDKKPLAYALAQVRGSFDYPSLGLIDWLKPSIDGTEPFLTFEIAPHQRDDMTSQTLIPDFVKALLKGRIVIVAGNIVGIDWHRMPLTLIKNEEVPGAFIHTQMLSQILEERSIKTVSTPILYILIFFSAILFFISASALKSRFPNQPIAMKLLQVTISSLMIVLAILSFWILRLSFPGSQLLLVLVLVILFGTSLSKVLSWLIDKTKWRLAL